MSSQLRPESLHGTAADDVLAQAVTALRRCDGDAAEVGALSKSLAAELANPSQLPPAAPAPAQPAPWLGPRGLGLLVLSAGIGAWLAMGMIGMPTASPSKPVAPVAPRPAAQTPAAQTPAAQTPAAPGDLPAPAGTALRSTDLGQAPVKPTARARSGAKRAQGLAGAPALSAENELELLARAQAALAMRPHDALSLSAEHRRRFERGVFAQEREVIAIEAELKLGRRAAAQRRAQRFLLSYPRSTHGTRVRALLPSARETKAAGNNRAGAPTLHK